jgi:hypothetical protein
MNKQNVKFSNQLKKSVESFDPLAFFLSPSLHLCIYFPLPYSLNDSIVFLVSQTKHINSLLACMSQNHRLDNAPRFHKVQFMMAILTTINRMIRSRISRRPHTVKGLEKLPPTYGMRNPAHMTFS